MKFQFSLKGVVEWGTYLLVFLLPWQTRWIYGPASLNGGFWEYGSSSLYATEILLWLVAVLFLVELKRHPVKFQRTKVGLILQLLIFWSLLTAIWSLDWNLTFYCWSVLVGGFLLYFLVSSGPAEKVKIMVSFIMAAAVQAALAFYQFLNQSIFGSKWLGMAAQSAKEAGVFVVEWGDERWLRAYGSLPHPNMLAAFLVIALIFILGLSFIAETRQKRLFLALSYLLIIPALVFSFSRAAWLVLGLAYVVTIVWMIYKKHKSVLTIQLLVLGALLVVLISAVFWHPVSARLFGGERLETISNQTRLALYEESKTLIAGSWYRGVGLGNYTLAVFRLIDGSQAVYLYQPVHNIFLLILSELGIFGLLFYLAAIIYLLKTKEGWISKLAFIGLLIIGLFDHFLWSLYFGVMLWWLVAGLVQGKAREEN